MTGKFGEVYLVDWGLAAHVDHVRVPELRILGTPTFMAPECFAGEPLTEATDVFLLGATLHLLLTGTMRHRGQTLEEVLLASLDCEPVDYGPEVPEELAALANQATARNPVFRPKSVSAFAEATTTSTTAPQRCSAVQRTAAWCRFNKHNPPQTFGRPRIHTEHSPSAGSPTSRRCVSGPTTSKRIGDCSPASSNTCGWSFATETSRGTSSADRASTGAPGAGGRSADTRA